jgi:hypothetical protein
MKEDHLDRNPNHFRAIIRIGPKSNPHFDTFILKIAGRIRLTNHRQKVLRLAHQPAIRIL